MELMVVVAIIGLLLAAVIPGLAALRSGEKTDAAINAGGIAAAQARQLSTQASAKLEPIRDAQSPPAGAAAIFNVGDEVLIANFARITDGAGNVFVAADGSGFALVTDREPAPLPESVMVFGLRDPSTLLPPPFAVHFNRHGHLTTNEYIYVDANRDGTINTTGRTAGYNPTEPNWNNTAKRNELPFEKIETVIAVLAIEEEDMENVLGGPLTSGAALTTAQTNALLGAEDARLMYLSRYSGAPVRDFK